MVSSVSVTLALALTTTTRPLGQAVFYDRGHALNGPGSSTEVPPNFITIHRRDFPVELLQ